MAETRERPILFSAPMVQAILADTKTQTRRVVKPQPSPCDHKPWPGGYTPNWVGDADGWHCAQCGNGHRLDRSSPSGVSGFRCPYGQPGDRLWVRETWSPNSGTAGGHLYRADHGGASAFYQADLKTGVWTHATSRWRPSIHMPRAASRITLEVTGVRVERLQDISEEDAEAEGVAEWARGECSLDGATNIAPGDLFGMLWSSINGYDGPSGWNTDPWVWVVEFRRIEGQP